MKTFQEGLEEAARLTCSLCREGRPVERAWYCFSVFHHPAPPGNPFKYQGCSATRIWERLAEERKTP